MPAVHSKKWDRLCKKMKLRNLPSPIGCILILISVSCAQLNPDHSGTSARSTSGIVIETVTKNSEAERAGIQAGDILLTWTRSDAKGALESPFDLSLVEIEQAPRGKVTLQGLRGEEQRSWMIGPDAWGIEARPNFQGKVLKIYQEGQELAGAGRFSEAAERWRVAAAEGQIPRTMWVGPWLLFHTATTLGKAGLFKDADDAYQQAVQTTGEVEAEIAAQLFRAWADAFQKRSDWGNAEKYYRQALEIREKLAPGSLAVAANFYDLGVIAWSRRDVAKAEEYYLQALQIRQRLAPGSLDFAASIDSLGSLAWSRDDLATAEEYYRQALEIRQRLAPGSLAVAASFYDLGVAAGSRGDVPKAEEYYRQALEIRQRLAPGSLDVARTFNNLGTLAGSRGDLTKAEEYIRQSLDIKQKLAPGSLDVASSLSNLGYLSWNRGDLAKAEEFYRETLEIQRRLAPESLVTSIVLNNLGEAAWSRGDLARAEDYYRQALEIRQKLAPGGLEVAVSLNHLGSVARSRGELGKAEDCYRQALEIRQKLAPGSLDVAVSLNNLGNIAKDRRNLAQAEEYYNQGLTITEKIAPDGRETADILQGLADLYRERRDLVKAEQYYRRATAIWEKLAPGSKDYAETLAALASILRDQQQPYAAAPLYEEALNALETQTAHLGGSDDARWDFRAQHAVYYKDYIDLLIRQERPEQAFSVLERSRARALLETLATAHVDIRKGIEPGLLSRERSLQTDIAAKSNRRIRLLGTKHSESQILGIEKEISNLLTQYQEVEEKIRSSSPMYAALMQPRTLSIKEVQQLLDSNTLLLEYSLGEECSYVFAATVDSLAVFALPKRIEIEAGARNVYDLLTARNKMAGGETDVQAEQRWKDADARYLKVAADLSQMLLGPVATLLKNKRLLIVSDGALQYIPFAALPEPARANSLRTHPAAIPEMRSARRTERPLVVEHEIVNLPSASVMAELRREELNRQEPSKAVAVLADPVFDSKDERLRGASGKYHHGPNRPEVARGSLQESSLVLDHLTRSATEMGFSENGKLNLSRLEYTRQEANSILAVTPRGQGFEALDFQASRQMAMSPALAEYRVVHFATHGILNSKHPELSGLVFSLVDKNGGPQDGFLDLQDIYDLNLPVDLVVLSGCETGLGKEINGEGLIGLTRGFMYAGSSRVMASLWSVSDEATAELMAEFYKAMEHDKKSPTAALRAAQIKMWKQDVWRSPYYWAAFAIQGEWR